MISQNCQTDIDTVAWVPQAQRVDKSSLKADKKVGFLEVSSEPLSTRWTDQPLLGPST